MITLFLAGAVLGLSAGFSPGPLLALVIAQSLRHGAREGIKVALVPLLTDLPIIAIALGLLVRFAHSHAVLGMISLGGAVFVLHLGYRSMRVHTVALSGAGSNPHSLHSGMTVNVLSPHPYLFWLTVGAPMVLKAWADGVLLVACFVGGFYACLVGAKVFLAVLVGRSRHLLSDENYTRVMRALGLLLMLLAVLLVRDGVRLLQAGTAG